MCGELQFVNIQHLYVSVQVADMLLELCVTELEDVATDSQSGRLSSQPVVVESSHPYTDDTSTSGTVKIPGKKNKQTQSKKAHRYQNLTGSQ